MRLQVLEFTITIEFTIQNKSYSLDNLQAKNRQNIVDYPQ
jgi:hypothetical protein